MSVAMRIEEKIKRLPKGKPIPVRIFRACGSEAAVHSALSRLVKGGELVSLARGVYARPAPNRFFGSSVPGPHEVAQVIARTTGERLAPHGAEIANQLGLSTQVSVQKAFYTTGRTRSIKVGEGHVHFKHAPRVLVEQADTDAGRVLLALHYFGPKLVTPELLKEAIRYVPAQELLNVEGAPAWLRERLARLETTLRA